MRKIIAIGESIYDIIFKGGVPAVGFPGGRILNASASVAKLGVHTTFVSECAMDYMGEKVVAFLDENGVDTNSIDRYVDGTTRLDVINETSRVEYGVYPEERFDVVWPRIDEDDIVIFGSWYSVDNPQREKLYELLKYASERKAILFNIPGFYHDENFRMTKVMPAVLENLEISNLVLTNPIDIKSLFGEMTPEETYKEKVSFYCQNYINVPSKESIQAYFGKGRQIVEGDGMHIEGKSLGWRAGFIAGVVYGMIANEILHSTIDDTPVEIWDKIISIGHEFAENADNPQNVITSDFAEEKRKLL